jgi:hypothetical protein
LINKFKIYDKTNVRQNAMKTPPLPLVYPAVLCNEYYKTGPWATTARLAYAQLRLKAVQPRKNNRAPACAAKALPVASSALFGICGKFGRLLPQALLWADARLARRKGCSPVNRIASAFLKGIGRFAREVCHAGSPIQMNAIGNNTTYKTWAGKWCAGLTARSILNRIDRLELRNRQRFIRLKRWA